MFYGRRKCDPCKQRNTDAMYERRRANKITDRVRAEVIARDGMVCRHCGINVRFRKHRRDIEKDTMELDHITPLIDGGDSSPANLVVSCLWCNRKRQPHRRLAST